MVYMYTWYYISYINKMRLIIYLDNASKMLTNNLYMMMDKNEFGWTRKVEQMWLNSVDCGSSLMLSTKTWSVFIQIQVVNLTIYDIPADKIISWDFNLFGFFFFFKGLLADDKILRRYTIILSLQRSAFRCDKNVISM